MWSPGDLKTVGLGIKKIHRAEQEVLSLLDRKQWLPDLGSNTMKLLRLLQHLGIWLW